MFKVRHELGIKITSKSVAARRSVKTSGRFKAGPRRFSEDNIDSKNPEDMGPWQ